MNSVTLKAMPPQVKNAKFENLKEEALVDFAGVAAEYEVEIERWFGIMMLGAGCFAESIGDPSSIIMLAHHYGDSPIGIASSFKDSEKQLDVDFKLNPNTQPGKEMISNLNNSIIAGLSVGFDTQSSEIIKVGEGARAYEVERITQAKLREISVVVWPAIDGARVKQSERFNRVRPTPLAQEDYPETRAALQEILSGRVVA